MVAALRRLGFEVVFDTDFGADLTIMEEGSELIERLKYGGKLPMITSCSPGWIKLLRKVLSGFRGKLVYVQITAHDAGCVNQDVLR